jgi:hypothetical protein
MQPYDETTQLPHPHVQLARERLSHGSTTVGARLWGCGAPARQPSAY